MSTMLTESEFLSWEKATREDYPERALYYDPRTERAFLLYYNPENNKMNDYYVLSEGQDSTGSEILFKYSKDETGDFQNVSNVDEFKARANQLAEADDPLMN